MDHKLLGVTINYVTLDQAVETVEKWLKKRGKHYIVTPNPEMLTDAAFDREFMDALNASDLAIPDSLRLGWGSYLKSVNNPVLRLIYAPSFIFPHILPRFSYPKTHGIDLMERLLSLSREKGFTTGYLGGTKKVADKLLKCLRLKYPGLKIVFCSGDMVVNEAGIIQFDSQTNKKTQSKHIDLKSEANEDSWIPDQHTRESTGLSPVRDDRYKLRDDSFNHHLLSHKIDIMFVAFGHKKQEKWMYKNLPRLNTRVMIGVGGAFDYLSGEIPRAPQIMRNLGLEWLFRFIVQPWRVKRLWKLVYFIYMVISRSK